jgi:putative membrane protein
MFKPTSTEGDPGSVPRGIRGFFLVLWPPLPVWKRLDAALLVIAGYTAVAVLVAREEGLQFPEWGGGSTILNAIVLGMLLGLRNREAFNRWWEGRQLWGKLINDCRGIFAKAAALPGLAGDRAEIGRLVAGFAVALKLRLRSEGGLQKVPSFEKSAEDPAHAPLHLFSRLIALLQNARTEGRITELDLLFLEPNVRGLIDVSGGCERIKNTPIPLSYRALSRHGLILYLLSTPWFIADHLGWYSIPVMCLLAYFLLGTELTAEDIEEPFGRDGDDLALSAYCETVARAAEQTLGTPPLAASGSASRSINP